MGNMMAMLLLSRLFCHLPLHLYFNLTVQVNMLPWIPSGLLCPARSLWDVTVMLRTTTHCAYFSFSVFHIVQKLNKSWLFKKWKWLVGGEKTTRKALARGAQWVRYQPARLKVTCLIPSQGACLGCRFGSYRGVWERQPIDVSLPLFLPLFPSVNK